MNRLSVFQFQNYDLEFNKNEISDKNEVLCMLESCLWAGLSWEPSPCLNILLLKAVLAEFSARV